MTFQFDMPMRIVYDGMLSKRSIFVLNVYTIHAYCACVCVCISRMRISIQRSYFENRYQELLLCSTYSIPKRHPISKVYSSFKCQKFIEIV